MAGAFKLRGYTVERLLGSGGSGDVWQARVGSSGPRVALKRIAITDGEQLRRAHAEAALLSALDHPNLVRLHSIVPTDDAVVLVLDLADGGSLAELLAARGRLAAGEVITAIAPTAAALAYLHRAGVVHGDVSAANILFSAAGVALLADVGVARLTGDDADAEATPAYVDPAVAAGCVPGPPSDVFMLAGVALHALTGAPPWPAASAEAALTLAAVGVLDDVAERLAGAGVPPAMAAVLCRSLAVDPHRRGTAADLALDLRHSGEPVAVELAAGRPRPEPQPVTRTGPRHAARPAVAGAAAADGSSADPPTDRSRPSFDRPARALAGSGVAPPTRLVGARPRPTVPRPRSRPRRRARRRLLAVAGAALLVLALALAGLAWARGRSARAVDVAANRRAQVETKSPTAVDWSAALSDLDAVRAQAFATRNAELLRQVYVPGPLLVADTALLNRLVPGGCVLTGARTRYTGLRTAAHGNRIDVTVTATLRPSRLVCGGHVRATAPGAGPATLQLTLTRTAAGLRIASQRVA